MIVLNFPYEMMFWSSQNHPKVKWFADGAQFNTNHEMLIWLWSSSMAKTSWCTKFVFACIPMRYLPTKSLRAKANRAITKVIAWDSLLDSNKNILFLFVFSGVGPKKKLQGTIHTFGHSHPSTKVKRCLKENSLPLTNLACPFWGLGLQKLEPG